MSSGPFNRIQIYILSHFLRYAGLSLLILILLFLTFDFFDRIDNILADNSDPLLILQYFLLKTPLNISLMLPIAVMAGVLLSLGTLSKNSEITAMRASGLSVFSLLKPLLLCGVAASFVTVILNESVVPGSQKRSREIYNIDIKKKDKSGTYSQDNIWLRNEDTFYAIERFDSRRKALDQLTILKVNESFKVRTRADATQATWLNPAIGWSMRDVTEYHFTPGQDVTTKRFRVMPLPITNRPSDFFDVKTDPYSMSFSELRRWIRQQASNGLDIQGYLPYLYEKLSFPVINVIVVLLVAPFAIRSARSGGMALSVVAALIIGFSYYAVHSFSIAFGRAELLPAALSAWVANILMGMIGLILVSGSESPQ